MEKAIIRKRTQTKLKQLTRTQKEHIQNGMYRCLFSTSLWQQVTSIGITLAQLTEWDTRPIIQRAWKDNKRVAVPKVNAHTREMTFYQLDRFDQLHQGAFDIQEPIVSHTHLMPKIEIALMVVPGVAFTLDGARLGFGGGFYDRFLVDFTGQTVALLAAMQLYAHLPQNQHDCKIDQLIVEHRHVICTDR